MGQRSNTTMIAYHEKLLISSSLAVKYVITMPIIYQVIFCIALRFKCVEGVFKMMPDQNSIEVTGF